MSLVYQNAQLCRVWVTPPGGSEVEITGGLISLLTKNSPLGTDEDLEGGIKTTGTLTLMGRRQSGFDFELDRRNTNLWNRGNLIRAQIRKRDGNFAAHPRGALRIIKTPPVPQPGDDFEIEIGCDAAYLDIEQEEVESNSSIAINPLTGINLRTAINLLGTRAGMPSLIDEIDGDERIFSLRSRLDGNRWDEMCKLALPSLQYLWCDRNRNLRASTFNLDASPAYTLNADRDVSRFEESFSDLPSADDVTVRTRRRVRFSISVSQAPTEITLSGNLFANPTVLTTSETSPSGTTTSTITKFYGDKDFLVREVQEDSAPRQLIAPEQFENDTTTVPSRRQTTAYTIVNDIVVKITTDLEEPAQQVRPTSDGGTQVDLSLIPSRRETVEYTPVGSNWLETRTVWDLRTGESFPTVKADPQIAPPSPTTRPKDQEESEEEDSAESRYEGTSPRRRRTVTFPIRVRNSTQTRALANLVGRLQYGAAQSAEWECEIFDGLVDNYSPQQVWEFTQNGFTYRYLSDAHVFELTPTTATFGAIGYYLGRVAVGGVLIPPANPIAFANGRSGSRGSVSLSTTPTLSATGRSGSRGSAVIQRSPFSSDLVATGLSGSRGSVSIESQPVCIKVWRNLDQSIPNNTLTDILFNVNVFSNGNWQFGAGTTITFPASGTYLVGASVTYLVTGSANADLRAYLVVGGQFVDSEMSAQTVGTALVAFSLSSIVRVTIGQTASLRLFQVSGATQGAFTLSQHSPILWANIL